MRLAQERNGDITRAGFGGAGVHFRGAVREAHHKGAQGAWRRQHSRH